MAVDACHKNWSGCIEAYKRLRMRTFILRIFNQKTNKDRNFHPENGRMRTA
jgi:hypothetical protein